LTFFVNLLTWTRETGDGDLLLSLFDASDERDDLDEDDDDDEDDDLVE
jgi:hypothetical protein